MLGCAHINGFLLVEIWHRNFSPPTRFIGITVGTILGNGVLLILSDFNPLSAILPWFPAIAAFLAVILLRPSRR
jgi:hypothetical protein